MGRFVLIAIALVLICGVADTQARSAPFIEVGRGDKAKLLVDHAVFALETPEHLRLEVYYQVYNFALAFTEVGNVHEASYQVSVTIEGRDGLVIDSVLPSRTTRVENLRDSRFNYRTNQVNFDLTPGKYTVVVLLKDLSNAIRIKRDFKVRVKPFDRRAPQLSDIELVQAVVPRDSTTSHPGRFDKGKVSLIPSLTGAFGGDQMAPLRFYFEIYGGGEPDDRVLVETVLRKKTISGSMVYRDSLTAELDAPVVRQLREIGMDSLAPGEYELEVTLRGRRLKKLCREEKTFSVVWTQEALLRDDYKIVVDQIALIASKEEVDLLKAASGSLRESRGAFESFWRKKDPTPTTPANEVKHEFYRRVRLANANFKFMGWEGWRSDRGRILIRYGEPDQVDDHTMVMGGRPYQEWHYYRYGRYRWYRFVDMSEDGDYRLQHPYDGFNDGPEF